MIDMLKHNIKLWERPILTWTSKSDGITTSYIISTADVVGIFIDNEGGEKKNTQNGTRQFPRKMKKKKQNKPLKAMKKSKGISLNLNEFSSLLYLLIHSNYKLLPVFRVFFPFYFSLITAIIQKLRVPANGGRRKTIQIPKCCKN